MSRIYKAFEDKKAFIGFLTAGDPTLGKTEEFVLEMEKGFVRRPLIRQSFQTRVLLSMRPCACLAIRQL